MTFTPADLKTVADERVQVRCRLANRLGLSRVYAIDEQPEGDEPDYYPFDKVDAWAKVNGRTAALDATFASTRHEAAAFEAAQKTRFTVPLLAEVNGPAEAMARAGRGSCMQPAELRCRTRPAGARAQRSLVHAPAKIFAKLPPVAKPGYRIVVVFGAGDGYWLRHFVQTVPGLPAHEYRQDTEHARAALTRGRVDQCSAGFRRIARRLSPHAPRLPCRRFRA